VLRWGSGYDRLNRLLFLGKEQRFREESVDLAEIKSGDCVLDVGCGTGNLTIAAKLRAGSTGQVHGIDAAPEMIQEAGCKAARRGLDVDFRVAVVEELPFPDSTFDVVLSSLMLHHLPEAVKRKGFAEIRRVLKPGGRFFAVDLDFSSRGILARILQVVSRHHMIGSNLDAIEEMAKEAGFRLLARGTVTYNILRYLRATVGESDQEG
jgi:demethylmenaquinone methyltransferase/2-methoxy-6-polyprenyl-1,4-benzoquinol methylase/phosphoethanolamine N-methyltransferase